MNKKGFTLIEIIIVIVILGILATLALPRITGQMEGSRAAEVMNLFGTLRRSAVDCADANNNDTANCISWANLGMSNPSSTNFTYTATSGVSAITFDAERVTGGTHICMRINTSTGATGYSYVGPVFAGVVNRTQATIAGFACAAGAGTLGP